MAEKKEAKTLPNIDIYKAWCKACGICAHFCPGGVLARDEGGYPYVKHIDKCTKCGWCEVRCPDFAITVTNREKIRGKEKGEGEEEAL